MTNTEKAKELLAQLGKVVGIEAVKLSSELAEGSYMLKDGTTFDIDAEGNLINVKAPTEEMAAEQEAARAEEERVAMAAIKEAKEDKESLAKAIENLKLSSEKVEGLEAEVVNLTKTKKIVVAPKTKTFEKIELTASMTYKQRVAARTQNLLNR